MSADNPDTRIVENLLEAEQEASDQDFALSIRQLEDKIRLHSAVVLELHREKKALVTQLADAQATIAALQDTIIQMGGQAAVLAKDAMAAKEQLAALQAERDEYKTMYACLTGETYDNPIADLKAQLTQRTAELEAAKRERDKIVEARQNMLQSMANWLAQLKPTHHPLYRKGVEEVIAAAFNGYRTDKGQPVLLSEWQEQQIRLANLQAELERVRGERDKLQSEVDGWELGSRGFP